MIELQSILNKKEVDGEIDLLSNIPKTDSENIVLDNFIIVDEQTEMRPDIISYVTGVPIDAILKLNNISNPFSIVKGTVLIIPTAASYDKSTEEINISQNVDQKNKVLGKTDIEAKIKENKNSSTANPSRKAKEVKNFVKSSNGILKF